MSIGNWKNHTLVECFTCKKLMGYHVKTNAVICGECHSKENVKIYMDKIRDELKKENTDYKGLYDAEF